MYFIAFLVYCTLDGETCRVSASNYLHETEEACYENLAYGISQFEEIGYAVPVYKCISLEDENV